MLRRELAAGAGRHADDQRDAELSAGHVTDGRRVVDDLVERQQAEIDRHHLDDRPHAAEGRADAGADERGLRQRRVADPLRPELLEQPLLTAYAPPYRPTSSPIRKTRGIALQRLPESPPNGLAIGRRGQLRRFARVTGAVLAA